jgi:hypothetical protein
MRISGRLATLLSLISLGSDHFPSEIHKDSVRDFVRGGQWFIEFSQGDYNLTLLRSSAQIRHRKRLCQFDGYTAKLVAWVGVAKIKI